MKVFLMFFALLGSMTLWASEVININSASQKELETLKGVGPVIAKRIVQYRESNGLFADVSDLQKIKGISNTWVETNKSSLVSD